MIRQHVIFITVGLIAIMACLFLSPLAISAFIEWKRAIKATIAARRQRYNQ